MRMQMFSFSYSYSLATLHAGNNFIDAYTALIANGFDNFL